MWKVALLVAVSFAFAEGCTYKDAECPDYVVVEEHPDFEIRSYPSVTWATTSSISRYSRVGQYAAFMKLFRYIGGNNDREQKMAMTVPVRMKNTKLENDTTLFEMSFFVPTEFSSNPPVPDDTSVQVHKEDNAIYAVRKFGGYAWRDGNWEEEAQKLAESVEQDESVDKTYYYRVGYDAPFDFFDRHNEVWMVKRNA